jgi:competence protein ComEA
LFNHAALVPSFIAGEREHMFKKIVLSIAAFIASVGIAYAAVDVNKATQAELDSVKGIGPAISKAIVDERAKGGPFKDWADFETRVKGVGEKSGAKMSEAGLTVGGKSYAGAPAKADMGKKEEKKPVADAGKKEEAKPAATATAAKPDAKPAAAAGAAAAPKAAEAKKEEPKKEMSKADQAKADKEAKAKAKEEKDAKAKADKEAKAQAKKDAADKAKAEKEAKAKAASDKDAKAKDAKKDEKKS